MREQLPHLAERILLKLVGARDGEVIAGDLRESFEVHGVGRLWYWMQVASCVLIRLSPRRRMLPELGRDLHYALRIVRRNPGYAATAMICLALGIGVNTTVFSWLDEMYFRRLPVPEAGRVVTIDRAGGPACSWQDYRDLRQGLRSVIGVAAVIPKETFLDVDRVNDQIFAEVVSANYFDVLGVQPTPGRGFLPPEDAPSSEPLAVISDQAWNRHFRRDRTAIGRLIRIEDQWYRIAGVAPAGFRGVSAPLAVDAWVPLATYPHYRSELATAVSAAGPDLHLIARLARSESVASASAEFHLADTRMREREPRHPRFKNRLTVRSATGYGWVESQRRMQPIAALASAVVMVIFLIACVNVANLLLSRSAVRRREMEIRRAIGAGRAQLVRQGIMEGLVLAAGAALLGILFGAWANHAITAALPSSHPDLLLHAVHLEVNWRVASFMTLLALFGALLFSISPAIENVQGTMARSAIPRSWGQRDILVIAQVALSLVLLVAAGLMLRALQETAGSDPGFATDKRLYLRLFTPDNDFTPQQATALYSRLLTEARSLPGVRDATLSFAVFGFMDGDCASASVTDAPRKLHINVVESNYFDFLRVPLLRGRGFDARDHAGSPRVVIVNDTMARRWWPGEDPVGKTVWLGCKPDRRLPAEVIGVVRDSKYGSLDESPRPFYFAHWRQMWWNGFFALMVHAAGDPRTLAEPLLELAKTGGSNLRTYELRRFDDLLSLSQFRVRWQATLLGAFSLLAIALAAVGLYGLVAYMVSQRTREIGVRMALGANSADVQWMVLSHGLRLAGIGTLAGLAVSAGVAQLLRRFLFGVSPLDPMAFAMAAMSWIVVAMLASWAPARRATRVEPVVALRYE